MNRLGLIKDTHKSGISEDLGPRAIQWILIFEGRDGHGIQNNRSAFGLLVIGHLRSHIEAILGHIRRPTELIPSIIPRPLDASDPRFHPVNQEVVEVQRLSGGIVGSAPAGRIKLLVGKRNARLANWLRIKLAQGTLLRRDDSLPQLDFNVHWDRLLDNVDNLKAQLDATPISNGIPSISTKTRPSAL